MAGGWVDAQEEPVEGGSQMGQGNHGAGAGERDSGSQRTDGHCSGHRAWVSPIRVTVALGSPG